MAEKRRNIDADESFEVNPDGADLDGTAEIERQHNNEHRESDGSSKAGEEHESEPDTQSGSGVTERPSGERRQ
jgi:hypothetical protein